MRSTQALRQGWSIQQLENDSPDIAALSQSAFDGGSGWMPAIMPAQVHDVLFALGKIPDPHVGKNAAECTWVGEKDWAYAGSFASPAGSGPAFLRFNGLDTLARVYLNQTLIGSFDDMNRRYCVEVRRLLKPAGEQNQLLILFSSPLRYIREQEARYGKREGIPAHHYLRKSMSDFSNYLGAQPMFPKVGVFDDVILDLPDASWLEDVWVRPFLSADLVPRGRARAAQVRRRTRPPGLGGDRSGRPAGCQRIVRIAIHLLRLFPAPPAPVVAAHPRQARAVHLQCQPLQRRPALRPALHPLWRAAHPPVAGGTRQRTRSSSPSRSTACASS